MAASGPTSQLFTKGKNLVHFGGVVGLDFQEGLFPFRQWILAPIVGLLYVFCLLLS
jgi:hypothetical protein